MVSAGEVSGDVHGSGLVKELKKLDPNLTFFGMGSELLAAQGVDVHLDIIKKGTIGLLEALPNLVPLYFAFSKMKKLLREEKPDLLILIDSQGFNVPLAQYAKKIGVRTVYYVSPQEWLWGTERAGKKIADSVDLIIAIFQREYDFYKELGANVVFFGHPLLDIVKPSLNKAEALKQFFPGVPHIVGPVISLCPGSRLQEIKGLLPTLLKVGEIIRRNFPSAKFLLPVASSKIIKDIFDQIGDFKPRAIVGHTYDILNASDLCICTSGTINLEASILKVPNIMVYRLKRLTYLIGKYILHIDKKIPYFSMPNILSNKKIIPELVMRDANPQKIALTAINLLSQDKSLLQSSFSDLHRILGSPGVIPKVASEILRFSKR